MNNREFPLEDNVNKLCIPIGTAVSAKFRGAFCEATVNSVDKIILCRIQLVDNKKTIKVNAEDIIGNIFTNSKVQIKIHSDINNAVILKIIDNSIYHVVFNDGDTGRLRRNQLVLKGDRHYKESESLDQHPLTNPEHFTKAVIYEKRLKDKSDAEDDEFDNDDQKSFSEESLTTVSSNKTRRQQTHTSSPSVGTAGSSLTAKTSDDVNKTSVNKVTKLKKHANTKYLIGCLVIVNRIVRKLSSVISDSKTNKKSKPFVALIVSPSSCTEDDTPDIRSTQCVVKSFQDDCWYITYKRDLELIVKRDMLIKQKESDPDINAYIEKCLLFFDAKIFPDFWDQDKLLYSLEYPGLTSPDRKTNKSAKSRLRTSLTNSLTSSDSDSSDERNAENDKSDSSDQEHQSAKDEWVARFYGFWEDKGSPINHGLEIHDTDVDIYQLYELVKEYGGFQKVNTSVRWPYIYHRLKLPNNNSENYQRLQNLYKKFIYPYVDMKKKLGTFEQTRNRKHNEKPANVNQKARPILSAREKREYMRQISRKTIEAHSVSSQSVCERPTDHAVSGDEIGTNSLIEDTSQLSQCSSSPKPVFDRAMDVDGELKPIVTPYTNRLSPGTIVSVSYGDKKVYKAKIIQQHSPEIKSLKSPSTEPKITTPKNSRVSMDTLSNADSVSSTNNDFKSEIDSSTFYKVHYIGWNSRHDEIISPERILGIVCDTGMDNQSTCSSSCRQKPTVSDNEQTSETMNVSNEHCSLSTELNANELSETFNTQDAISDNIISEENIELTEKKDAVQDNEQINVTLPEEKPIKSVNLKRRRSRSVCFNDFENISTPKLPVLSESRIIASLNLYKIGDKMPLPPKRLKYQEQIVCEILDETLLQDIKIDSPCHEPLVENPAQELDDLNIQSDISNNLLKNEIVSPKNESDDRKEFFPTERNRSPSFSNDSLSDASTLPFKCEQDQSLFYISPNEDSEKSPHPAARPPGKSGNKRGRKPIFRPDKKPPNPTSKQKENRVDIVEIESTSSQHSGSVHGRRVTRSLRNTSDQNTIDDNSMQFEDDSQTSQDDSTFQLPTVMPLDMRSVASSMTPLASGTPTSHSSKGRRPKSRRKIRNSLSTSSADGGYQDSNGENNVSSMIISNSPTPTISQSSITDLNNSSLVNISHRPNGRPFQRLHPSLIPVGLEKLLPEERVKILESVIRQTHFNFLDVKDKIKYVEKQISEIKNGRANGHGIESDEDKFR